MKNLITIQHTQSVHHTNGMIGSWTDWDLTELGMKQAENIGIKLAAELKDKSYVMYASDLKRAKQTAEAVAKCLNIQPMITEVLRERNLGRAVGQSVEWFRKNMQCQEKTVDDRFFNDAESRRDVWARIEPLLKEIVNGKSDNVIIVSHGDTLSVLNAMWLGLKADDLNHCDLFGLAGGVSFLYENADGKHIIKRMSDMSYITPSSGN